MPCKNSEWINCYKGDRDLATDESNSHPAKAAWGLAFRIVEHLEELGLLRPGDCVLDPMAGTGRFLLAACAKGYRAVGVELEPAFVEYVRSNKAHAEKKLGHSIDLTILQGDSRRLSELLSERGLIMVSSPPYVNITDRGKQDNGFLAKAGEKHHRLYSPASFKEEIYGQSSGQIGNMPEGKVIVTSPPYEGGGHHKGMLDSWGGANTPVSNNSSNDNGYGNTEGQIEKLSYWTEIAKVYAESLKVADVMVLVTKDPTRNKAIHPLGQMTADLITEIGWRIVDWHKAILYDTQEQGDLFGGSKKLYKGRVSFFKRLSLQKGSPAAAHEDVIFAVNPNGRRSGIVEVTSPPYSDSEGHPSLGSVNNDNWGKEGTGIAARRNKTGSYGATPGQIGNMPEGRVIISSPPYGNIETGPNGGSKEFENDRISKSHSERHGRHYSSNPDNIGNLRE